MPMLSDRRPILLANARIVDPSRDLDFPGDLLIADGTIRDTKRGIGVCRKLVRKSIDAVRRQLPVGFSAMRFARGKIARQLLNDIKRQAMQPPPVGWELQLISSLTQQRVTKQINLLGSLHACLAKSIGTRL